MKTEQILTLMKVLSWIVFIGLCIQTGIAITITALSFINSPEVILDQLSGADLTALFEYNTQTYLYFMSFVIALLALKAYLFYLVIKIFSKINLSKPFSPVMIALIQKISHIALGIGVVTIIAERYTRWLMHKGLDLPKNWSGEEFLFLAGIIYIIGLVFKRGIEMQSENELTI